MSIGTDFERFLERGGKVISAEFLGLPDKFEPHVELADAGGKAGYIHRDNVMVELCVAPQATAEGLSTAVARVLDAAREWLAKMAPDVVIGPLSGAVISRDELNTRAAKELGCDVDFIARDYDSIRRPPLNAGLLKQERFAGGHLHFSWPREDVPAWVGAAVCDLLIGLPEAGHLNPLRAQFYGAGSLHRPTEYPDGTRGVEYRPLDCYWTTNPESLDRVARRAGAVHAALTDGSVEFLGKLVDLWQPLDASHHTLIQLATRDVCRAAHARAAEEFRKEFGYDPV